MTKPSYEEPEKSMPQKCSEHETYHNFDGKCVYAEKLDISNREMLDAFKDNERLTSELARVRGLLQRQWISVEERLPEKGQACLVVASGKTQYMATKFDGKEFVWADGYDYGESAFDPFPSEQATDWMPLPEKTQGAESADIGKLDAADKSGVDLSSGIPPDVWLNGGTQMCCNKSCPKYSPLASITCRRCMCSVDGKSGSAETGGEKAAWMQIDSAPKTGEHILVMDEGCTFGLCGGKMQPWYAIVHYWGHPGEEGFYLTHGDRGDSVYFTHWRPIEPPTFPRSPQNQTVSSGVEGAHEGTTADKKVMKAIYESREDMLNYSPSGAKPMPRYRPGVEIDEPVDSREPEKLNNAQRNYIFLCNVGHEFGYRCAADPPEGIQCAITGCNSTAIPIREDAALVSSLSSPPPKCKHCGCVITAVADTVNLKGMWMDSDGNMYCGHKAHYPASPELLPTQLPKEK